MAITIKNVKNVNDKTFFTVSIDGTDIHDCKVVNGSKGEFVSGPAKKVGEKWVNLTWFSEAHQKEILAKVKSLSPSQQNMDDVPF